FSSGDGHVSVNPNNGTGVIQFGAGITASDVVLQSDGWGNLTVQLRGTSDYITINGDLSNNSWGVSSRLNQLRFADGTTVDIGRPAAGQGSPITFTWLGTVSTSMTGSNFGSNVFDVAPCGDNITFGNTASVPYATLFRSFSSGDGHVTVNPNSGTGVIQF